VSADAASRRASAQDRAPLLRAAVRAFKRYQALELVDRAAALAYYAMLALFPGLLVAVTLLGLLGQQSLVTQIVDYLTRHGADPTTAATLRNALTAVIRASHGALGAALGISVLLGLNGASGAYAAAGRALNAIHGVHDERGFVRGKLENVGMTLVVLALILVVLVAVFLGGGIVDDIARGLGLGHTTASVWGIARWPLAVVAAMGVYSVVYAYGPAIRPPALRWITPGATVGVVLWMLASLGFAIYIRNFSHYGAAYGAAGAAIVLLLWLFISANAFLFGATLNVELERELDPAGQAAGR
jgi:membrane protein